MAEKPFPPGSSRSNRCSTASRRRFEEGTRLVEEAHKIARRHPAGADRFAGAALSPEDSEEAASRLLASLKASGGEMPETLCGGRLAVDQVQRLIRIDSHPIGITEMEYRVLELLAFARNNVVTRADAAEASLPPVRRPAAAEDHRRVHLQAPQEAAHCDAAGRSSSRRFRSAAGSCATSTRSSGGLSLYFSLSLAVATGAMLHFVPELGNGCQASGPMPRRSPGSRACARRCASSIRTAAGPAPDLDDDGAIAACLGRRRTTPGAACSEAARRELVGATAAGLEALLDERQRGQSSRTPRRARRWSIRSAASSRRSRA